MLGGEVGFDVGDGDKLNSWLLLSNSLQPPYSKKLTSGIYELRTSGQIAVRILYANYQGIYYLLHAFKKQTQKTPTKELQTALDRKAKLI